MTGTTLRYYLKSIFSLLINIRNVTLLPILLIQKSTNRPRKIRLRTGETFFVFNFMDVWIIKETILDRQYEKASIPLQENWTVVDVGAALGDYSIWAARQVPNGRVIAVEPYSPSVELIRRNLVENRTNNVDVVEGAVAAKSGSSTLKLSGSGIVMNSTSSLQGSSSSVTVTTLTFSDLLKRYSIEVCDYLKMDCEGGEYDILFSLDAETLNRIHNICLEVHDGLTQYNRQDMVEFLEKHGYRTRLTLNPVHQHIAYLFAEKI